MKNKQEEKDKKKTESPIQEQRSVFSYIIDGIRLFFWPRGGWRRTIGYVVVQMKRLPASPYAISIGFAAGAFVSFTPFLGLHFLGAAGIAWIVRGNIIASALGTIVGNPFTFPFIWAVDYIVGIRVLEGYWLSFDEVSLPSDFAEVGDVFYPILIGSLPAGLLGGLLSFIPIYIILKLARRGKSDDTTGV